MNEPILIEVKGDDDGQRIERWLKKNAPHIPYALAQKLFRKGAIKIDGKKAKPADILQAGQKIRLPQIEERVNSKEKWIQPAATREDAEKYLLNNVIYEDENLVAINKPAGLASQGGSKVKVSVDDLLPFLGEGTFNLVHRIDKDTSGVMLIAKGRKAAQGLGKRFKSRDVEKIYWAIVVGTPLQKEGKIAMKLAAKKSNGKIEKAVVDEKECRPAITRYRVIETASSKLCWVELQPVTGRMHQLRVHMNEIGHPIMGDGKYGSKKAFIHGLSNLMHLHARQITLPNYKGRKPLTITADLPPHMQKTFKMFGFEG